MFVMFRLQYCFNVFWWWETSHFWYLTAHSTLADPVFYLTASKSQFFLFKFMAEVHNEVLRILILHSANVNIAVMYFYYNLNTPRVHFNLMV